jgi:type II secretory pathway predicted ATPase ExeA
MTRQTQYHEEWTTLRADQTCEFILSDTHFVNWYYASGSRQLVLLGEMGCGKTITMAFIVEQLRLREKENDQLPNPKICYHYCRDNETGKGVTILSVLILSLLQQLPGLKRQFSDWYKQVEKSGIPDPAASVQNLEDFLQKTLKSIDRPVFIVIDGLDECEKRTRKWLLEFLKNMLENIPSLRILLSSRPQENVLSKLGDAARIELGSNAQRDRIIVEKTVDTHLSDLSAEAKALVIHKLSDLAEGCAIWTKMTVKLIELRGLTMETEIKRFLEKMALPNELSELYNLLLSRCTGNDSENVQLAITALKLLAVTERPLSILELAWAATLSVAHDVTTVDALGERVDHRRILSLIHPFISRVDFSDVKKYQVRLVHQSVNEFILKECMSECLQIQGPAKGEADRMSIDQRSKRLESFILGICIRYLLLDEISKRDLFSEEQVAIAELPPECDIFSDGEEPLEYNPNCSWETWEENMIRFEPTERGFGEFFVYASCYWLKHFGTVEAEPLPGLINIERLCQAGSIRLHNWIQQNCRPGCTIAPRFEFDYRLYDPLSITSLYGSVAMLRNMLKNSNFAKDVFLADPAMGAADQILRWGDNSRLRVLFFDDQVGHQLRNLDFFRRIIKTWQDSPANSHHWDDVFALVDVVLDTMVQGRWGNELLCVAASAGCMPIIRRLMNSARHNEDLRSELFRGSRIEPQWTVFEPVHQSIGEAILGNHVDVVKYLVKENNIDAHLRYQNSRGENVLHLASIMCNPEMFDLLAPRFPEGVTQVDDRGDTALVRVVMNFSASGNRFESARILLSQTADWHLAEKHYRRLFMNLADDS